MKQFFKTAAFVSTGLLAGALNSSAQVAPASTATAVKTEMYVAVFRAEWCGPCRVMEPMLNTALKNLNDPSLEYVNIDISNPVLSEVAAHRAFDRAIVPQYNMWLGVTGFAAIIDADTKNTLGCVNMTYDAASMTTHIRNLKTYAVANKTTQDLTCPAPNN